MNMKIQTFIMPADIKVEPNKYSVLTASPANLHSR